MLMYWHLVAYLLPFAACRVLTTSDDLFLLFKKKIGKEYFYNGSQLQYKGGRIPTTPFGGKQWVVFVHFSFAQEGVFYFISHYTQGLCSLQTCLFCGGRVRFADIHVMIDIWQWC